MDFSKDAGNQDLLEGLSTTEAITKLCNDLELALKDFKSNKEKHHCNIWKLMKDNFSYSNALSLFRWSSAAVVFLQAVFLALVASFGISNRFNYLPFESTVLLSYFIVNCLFTLWETRLRLLEVYNHAKRTIDDIQDMSYLFTWKTDNYPLLHSPSSPCIALQWTKRDGNLINLPWSLLVKGDIIYLRPGQKVPGLCQSLEVKDGCSSGILSMGDVYSPYTEGICEGLSSPKARTPLQANPFVLQETPYLASLSVLLGQSDQRPVTFFSGQGYFIFGKTIEFIMAPLFTVLIVCIGIFRIYYDSWGASWPETLLVLPVSVTIPLVPLLMPPIWILLTWLGTARVLSIYNHERKAQTEPIDNPFEDVEMERLHLSGQAVQWTDIKELLIQIAHGTQDTLVRTPNLLHILGSVTNLCCVDKKGILSWPNPTAEKLFFLRNKSRSNALTKSITYNSDASIIGSDSTHRSHKFEKAYSAKESECVQMTLTHDHLSAFGLQFDDPSWKHYLLSLKPLGLNILLNTCNPRTHEQYTQFCSHITCEAMYDEDLVPVSHRRCLCELPNQMGFTDRASRPFRMEHQLCTFRHEPPDMPCKDRFAQSLMTTKLKFPFPHSFSVLMRDINSGKLELMSQGTGDIVLDSCTDYWDGSDVCTLTEKDRKKILDFYHRTSLSAYCTAFSYRPTTCEIKEDLSSFYLELPLNPSHLYRAAKTPTPHISTEALFGDEDHPEYEEITDVEDSFRLQCKHVFIGMVAMQYQVKADMVQLIEQLEEACIRFVHFSKENELRSRVFSEKMGLESGWNCHISLLSDKNKAESGGSNWSCNAPKSGNEDLHTSDANTLRGSQILRSFMRTTSVKHPNTAVRNSLEVFRTLSHSAPSAINFDIAQVKFEDVSQFSESFSDHFQPVDNPLYNKWASGSGECLINIERCESNISKDFQFQEADEVSRSSSQASSSDQTASLNLYDLSNRANLPKGIENIRPHLKNIDNVPLLVSLFTDCTTPTTKTMLEIMQENTEVIVLIGSTANPENIELFLRADLSLGVEPMYPQVCMQQQPFVLPENGLSPSEIARRLNALACSLFFHRDERISLPRLIMEGRHFMQHFMNCFQFWACCNVSVSVLLLLSIAAMLPPILSSGDILWLVSVPIPLLGISLVFTSTNPAVMKQATCKNQVVINRQSLMYICQYYVARFLPSLIVVLITAYLSFEAFCEKVSRETGMQCEYIYPHNRSEEIAYGGWDSNYSNAIVIVQKSVCLLLTFYFCIISVSFLHKMYYLWTKPACTNRYWMTAVGATMILQLIYSCIGMHGSGNSVVNFWDIPLQVWLLGICWTFVLLGLNELIRYLEIKVNVRYQKRARLEFGTKLGMNSPF